MSSKFREFYKPQTEPIEKIRQSDLLRLPIPEEPEPKPVPREWREQLDLTLDGYSALGLPLKRKETLVPKFLEAVKKLFSKSDNWTFLQPLILTTELCAKCQTS